MASRLPSWNPDRRLRTASGDRLRDGTCSRWGSSGGSPAVGGAPSSETPGRPAPAPAMPAAGVPEPGVPESGVSESGKELVRGTRLGSPAEVSSRSS
ncbi:MAG TPA: hypothetical protein VHF26_17190, partial [Trebonia sp.]|nr:hypothetical protein [Trebonia sp.]